MRIEFFVPGQSRPAGSKGAFNHPKTGKIIVTHANKKTKGWMDSVKWFAMQETNSMVPLTEAVCLTLLFLRDRPKSHYGSGRNADRLKSSAPIYCTTVPDLTKLTRAVEDALTGIVWKDDSQVVRQDTDKRYCAGTEKAGVNIIIETMDELGELDYGTETSGQKQAAAGAEGEGLFEERR
jgi:Holliday junction resolvase RusA-like endonuclease